MPPEAVLISGVFGSGKSSVVAEIAELIEQRGFRYAALDLDWLAWGWPGDDEGEMAEHRLMRENLELVVGNYMRRSTRLRGRSWTGWAGFEAVPR
jgi:adenylylsulfate kinase-like enzyme